MSAWPDVRLGKLLALALALRREPERIGVDDFVEAAEVHALVVSRSLDGVWRTAEVPAAHLSELS